MCVLHASLMKSARMTFVIILYRLQDQNLILLMASFAIFLLTATMSMHAFITRAELMEVA